MTGWVTEEIEIPGQVIHCLRTGDDDSRAPVVLFHGITASSSFWPQVLGERPWNGRRVCSASLPGHSPSRVLGELTDEEVTAEWFVRAAIGVCEHFAGDESVHLAGWSTGGFTALMTASTAPDRVLSVASLCGFARGQWGTLLGFMQRLASSALTSGLCTSTFSRLGRSPRLYEIVLRQLGEPPSTSDPTAVAAWQGIKTGVSEHDASLLTRLFRRLREMDESAALSSISCPALVLWGERDTVIPARESRELVAEIPECQERCFPNMQHMFFTSHREPVVEALGAWFDARDARKR